MKRTDVEQLSTSEENPAGYTWNRSLVKELPDDAGYYEYFRANDKPRKALTDGTVELVPIRLGPQYSVREKYGNARDKDDPLLSPHGFFRSLKFGSRKHGLEFTSQFGPLTWNPRNFRRGSDLYTRISLSDFWAKQRRFCRIAALVENYSDPAKLRLAFKDLHTDIHLIDRADSFPIARPFSAFRSTQQPFLDADQATFDLWTGAASDRRIQQIAETIIHRELVGQLHKRKPWYVRELPDLRFRLTLLGGSLYHMMWEMLAWDTNAKTFWRVCPHCGKLFYPPRYDRYYCTSRQQTLASKRNYAREKRSASKID